ncbi:hypothetical protein Syun_014051 [Stephania yunnanensis]|uniref:Uncharacterized protein n=1 Tax=Stephania yunnanensis TaxID=152371 RepID=A0AAP0JIK2_9MAGN
MKKKKKVVEGDDHGGDQGKEKMTGVGSQPPGLELEACMNYFTDLERNGVAVSCL